MENIVASTRIRRPFKQELFMKTKKAMGLARWQQYVPGKRILIMPDPYTAQMPGSGTSPYVLESVVRVIRGSYPEAEIFIGGFGKAFGLSSRIWALKEISSNWKTKNINLSNVKSDVGSMLKDSAIVRIPVFRHEARSPVSKTAIMPAFTVVDATVAMEGDGIFGMRLRILDTIIAGHDGGAVAKAASSMRGNKDQGRITYHLCGDLPHFNLRAASTLFSSRLYSRLWMRISGKRILLKTLELNPLYDQEFADMIKANEF